MARRYRYSLACIRKDYTYAVDEVAALYSITPDTVFRWIREDGLKRLPQSKKYFVHSSDLRTFLDGLNRRNKKPCAPGEVFCCKCRAPRIPVKDKLRVEKLPNGTVRLKGTCAECGTGLNKVVSGKNWSDAHPLHPGNNASTIEHSGAKESPRNCQTCGGDQ